MNRDDVKFAKNLKRLTKEKGLKITTLASKARINISTLHNYFNGVIPSHIISIKRIADYFDITIDQLLFEMIDKEKIEESEELTFEISIKKLK
jgi:transcriptional regulator with XRE-family HTH domain